VKNGSAPPIELAFDDTNAVRGRVTRGGTPVESGSVFFWGQGHSGRSTIGPGGRYQVDGVTPGDYNVSVSVYGGSGMMNLVYNDKYTVLGNDTYDIDIHGAALHGRVVDDVSGAPLSDVAVSLDGLSIGSRAIATDSDGKFSIEAVSDGKYGLRAQKERYAPRRQDLVVSGGDQDVELRLVPAPKTTLRVVDARDNHGIAAWVNVTDASHKPLFNGNSRGDDEPLSVWLEPGTDTAYVGSGGYVYREVALTIPGPDVRVALQAAGKLVIIAQTATRARLAIVPAALAHSNGVVPSFTLDPGNSVPLETLAPGAYVVELFGEGQTVLRTFPVTITAGETTTVTVQ
jgi:Carboxypeptidase regulatory-like domain